MSAVVRLETRGAARFIFIDRVERRNALNQAVALGIEDGLGQAEADPACRAVILTGAGDKAFCAGADLVSGQGGAPFGFVPSQPGHFMVRLLRRLDACPLPLIARVNGHALAGGLGLLCACDLAVASESALFGTPEAGVGLFPMMILPYLSRLLPARKLMELCLTAENVSAAEALAMGLVNYVVPQEQLDAKVDWLLARIAGKSPTAVRLGKTGLQAMRDMTVDQSLDYAQLMLATIAQTQDAAEGMAAFREKRPPVWSGK